MCKYCLFLFCICISVFANAQPEKNSDKQKDSISKSEFLRQLGNGYLPTKYVNIDLRYLIKFNQYEGFRTGLGGVTNSNLSKTIRINGYTVYGFKDDRFKYSIGGGIRISKQKQSWLNFSYTDDLMETGSSKFLTDKRFFQFFEPRLLNIDLFHRHITKSVSIEHNLSDKLLSELEFSVSNVNPTYNYTFSVGDKAYDTFHLSSLKLALDWSPFSTYETIVPNTLEETKIGYPKFSLQYTKSFKDFFKSNLAFSKIDFRTIYQINHKNNTQTRITLVGGFSGGKIPLTHLYHAYPNNITKETILQRFSVAGNNSFETMYFNEFFSDRFATFQLKHFLSPFNISERWKPQLVLIHRFAIGDMSFPERHLGITFNTLNKGYTESGFEFNKLIFGFGLSFAYRYGAYHLPKVQDNIALKFTFNLSF